MANAAMIRGFFLGLLLATGFSAELPPLAKAQAALLTSAEQAEPIQAIALLSAWPGDDHALRHLALAEAHRRAAELGDPEPQRSAAQAALSEAARLAPHLRAVPLAEARLAADREAWSEVGAALGRAAQLAPLDAQESAYAVVAALQAGDLRLALLGLERARLAWPMDARLRRLELDALMRAGRADAAATAALSLLASEPADSAAWCALAWAEAQGGDQDGAITALEAAVLTQPDAADLRRRLVRAQMAAGAPRAACATLGPLLGDTASNDDLRFAGELSFAAGDLAATRRWMERLTPEARQQPEALRLAARLALREDDLVAAAAALGLLLTHDGGDVPTLIWAGHTAQRLGDAALAEALYEQAAASEAPLAGTALLRLAVLLDGQGRQAAARQRLADWLATHPEDRAARLLFERLSAGDGPADD